LSILPALHSVHTQGDPRQYVKFINKKVFFMKILFLSLTALLIGHFVVGQPTPVMQCGHSFEVGVPLVSPNGIYYCYFQADGNLVVYDRSNARNNAIWNSETSGHTITNCILQCDGSFVLYNNTTVVCHSHSFCGRYPPYWIQMQDDGNLVIYNVRKQAIWSSKFGSTNVENPPQPKPHAQQKRAPNRVCAKDIRVHFKNNSESPLLVFFAEVNPGGVISCDHLQSGGSIAVGDLSTTILHKGKIGYFVFAETQEGSRSIAKRRAETWVQCVPSATDDVYFDMVP
jgi:hypothetical protein